MTCWVEDFDKNLLLHLRISSVLYWYKTNNCELNPGSLIHLNMASTNIEISKMISIYQSGDRFCVSFALSLHLIEITHSIIHSPSNTEAMRLKTVNISKWEAFIFNTKLLYFEHSQCTESLVSSLICLLFRLIYRPPMKKKMFVISSCIHSFNILIDRVENH